MTDTDALHKEKCDSCIHCSRVCPECGSCRVTIEQRGNGHYHSVGVDFETFGYEAEIGDSVDFARVCWDCYWEVELTLTVEEYDG